MIDLNIHDEAALERAVQRARERDIIIPTFKQQRDPTLVPAAIRSKLAEIGLWDLNPLNLFRITWYNDPVPYGGGYGYPYGGYGYGQPSTIVVNPSNTGSAPAPRMPE